MTRVTGDLIAAEDWNDYAQPEYVTALPGSPDDGEEVYFEAAAGVIWHLRYNASSASSFKWEFVGGPALSHEVATQETRDNSAYGDLTTVGPQVTLPLAGDYEVEYGVRITGLGSGSAWAAIKRGAAATSDNDAVQTSTTGSHHSRKQKMTGLSASAVLKMQYRETDSDAVSFDSRFLFVRPIRVG